LIILNTYDLRQLLEWAIAPHDMLKACIDELPEAGRHTSLWTELHPAPLCMSARTYAEKTVAASPSRPWRFR